MTGAAEATIVSDGQSASPDLWSLLNAGALGRAAVVALGLGTVLTVANQAQAIFGADPLQILPLVLVYLTPFVVVAVSQLLGAQQAKRDARGVPTHETFLSTTLRHGIPSRALRLGFLVGGLGASLVMTVALVERGDLATVSWASLAQGFTLPVLFGVLSQAIAYRRAQAITVKGDGQ